MRRAFRALRVPDVGAQEARERVTGRGGELRLLDDAREVERALDGEIRELEARAALQHPGPREAKSDGEQDPVADRLGQQLAARQRRAEARRLEGGVLP